MTTRSRARRGRRAPLTRDRVLRAAFELAAEGGLAALTMHNIGRRLGVEAMSLYRHVENKEDILVRLFDEVESRLRRAGVEPETRPFSPHLTIARFRDRQRGGRADRPWPADAIASARVAAGSMPVRSITLYQSRLTPAGPEYTPLASPPLSAPSEI